MHLRYYFQTIHSALLQTSNQSKLIWMVKGRLQFQKYPSHHCTKMLRREILGFLQETFKVIRIELPGTWFLPFHYGYC